MRHVNQTPRVIALFALAAAACGRVGSMAGEAGAPLPDVAAGVHLVVRNNSGGSVDVAVTRPLGAGPRIGSHRLGDERVGVVAARSVATFLLDDDTWDSGPVAVV